MVKKTRRPKPGRFNNILRLHPRTERKIAKIVIKALREMHKPAAQNDVAPSMKLPTNSSLPESGNQPEKANEIDMKPNRISLKPDKINGIEHMKVFIIPAFQEESRWRDVQLITDQFRLLVKEAAALKNYQNPISTMAQFDPDLLLVLGHPDPTLLEDLITIQSPKIKKAIWLSDSENISDHIKEIAAIFDDVFTQTFLNIPCYQYTGCKHIAYLPFAADPSLYFPKAVADRYKSDLIIIGNAAPSHSEHAQHIVRIAEGKTVYALGDGWEDYDYILPLRPDHDLNEYYNGTKIVVNWRADQSQIFNIAACGSFQLIEDHPNLYEYMRPGEDVIIFRTAAELSEKLDYYLDQPEQRRIIGSNALQGSKFHYSFLQFISRLLHYVTAHESER